MANRKSRLILLLGGLALLGAVAWGVGWGARALFDRWAALLPTATAEPTASLSTATLRPTDMPDSQPTVTRTQLPTSTPEPVLVTSTPAPTAEQGIEILAVIRGDRGVYDVVKRACGLPRDYILAPGDAIVRETWRLNSFVGERPKIYEGQGIQVPIHLCP